MNLKITKKDNINSNEKSVPKEKDPLLNESNSSFQSLIDWCLTEYKDVMEALS